MAKKRTTKRTLKPRKFTESELRARSVGKATPTAHYRWLEKRKTYIDAKVLPTYMVLLSKFNIFFMDEKGYQDIERAHAAACIPIDTYLLKLAAGKEATLPVIDICANKIEEDDSMFHNISEFGELADAEMNPVRDLTWIYNNIAVKDVKPSSAPSPGAFAHLKFIQDSDTNRVDFFTKVYPRIIPSKTQIENMTKNHDDGRSTSDLLDRLQAESLDDQGKISVL